MIAGEGWNSIAFDKDYRVTPIAGSHSMVSDSSVHVGLPVDSLAYGRRVSSKYRGLGFDGGITASQGLYYDFSGLNVFNFYCEHLERGYPPQVHVDAYKTRLEVLRTYAVLDGYDLNAPSAYDFWSFVLSESNLRRGQLVLLENGNVRAVWRNEGAHLGLQFLGDGMVQYVIFRVGHVESRSSRVSGRDSFDGLRRQIDIFDLSPLLYE